MRGRAILVAMMGVGIGLVVADDGEPKTWQEAWGQVRDRLERIDGRLERIEKALLGDQPKGKGDASEGAPEGGRHVVKANYIKSFVSVYEIEAKYYDDMLDGRIAAVFGKIKNTGTRTLKKVKVTAYFLDKAGKRIHEDSYYPIYEGGFDLGDSDRSPLKPDYIRKFGYKAKGCPAEWAEGRVDVVVEDIEFGD